MTIASEWRSLSRPAIGYDDSTELIQRAVAALIIEELPQQVALQQIYWQPRDQDWAAITGRPLLPTRITPVDRKNIYVGYFDMLKAPASVFPAVAVRCFNSVPADDREQADQYDQLELTLVIEVWTAIGPYTDKDADRSDQEQIDRQLHRLTAAVRNCVIADRSLGNTTMGIRRPPRAIASLPQVTKADSTATGPKFLLQAVELTYAVSALTF